MQQAFVGLHHHQRGHEVFKHRAGPGLEAGRHADGEEGAAQRLPVAPRHVAFGNRQEAGEARLRGHQVVKARVQRLLMHAQADVKEVALGAVKAAEVHGHAQLFAALAERHQVGGLEPDRCPPGRQLAKGLRHRQQVAGEVAAVYGGDIGRQQHLQRARFIPVEQVALVLGQGFHRVQRGGQPSGHFGAGDPAEFARAGHGHQVQADVGGRGAVGQRGLGLHLQVVGRQVLVFGADARAQRSARSGARA
jgi:hypothetical protein